MHRHSIKSRKGIGTAIGTAFFIIIVLLSISAFWTISSYEINTQNVRQTMTSWDTDRISENLVVRSLRTPSNNASHYTFDLLVDNSGGVTVKVARIYIYNQTAIKDTNGTRSNRALGTFNSKNLTACIIGFVNGTIDKGEVGHMIAVNNSAPYPTRTLLGTNLSTANAFRIVLTTDRGRQFSYTYPPPSGSGSGGGGYAIVIDDVDNFQYAAGTMTQFSSAALKVQKTDHTLYRVRIKNTTNKVIQLRNKSEMLHMTGAQGQTTQRYIVSPDNQNRLPTNNILLNGLTVFSTQSIASNSSAYICFAATGVGGTTFQSEPGQALFAVGTILVFNYGGETQERTLPLPVFPQELTAN
jgi:hypothetical protein